MSYDTRPDRRPEWMKTYRWNYTEVFFFALITILIGIAIAAIIYMLIVGDPHGDCVRLAMRPWVEQGFDLERAEFLAGFAC